MGRAEGLRPVGPGRRKHNPIGVGGVLGTVTQGSPTDGTTLGFCGGIPLGFGAGEVGELDVFSGSGKWLKSEKRYRGINAKARRCGDAKPDRDEFGWGGGGTR